MGPWVGACPSSEPTVQATATAFQTTGSCRGFQKIRKSFYDRLPLAGRAHWKEVKVWGSKCSREAPALCSARKAVGRAGLTSTSTPRLIFIGFKVTQAERGGRAPPWQRAGSDAGSQMEPGTSIPESEQRAPWARCPFLGLGGANEDTAASCSHTLRCRGQASAH